MSLIVQRLKLTRYEADEYYKEALEAYNKKEYEEAILKMGRAIDALPNHAEYYAARGLMYYDDGIDDKAKADFEKALKVYPYEMLAHYGLGMVAYRAGEYETAAKYFNDAYRLDTARPEILYAMALTYHKLDRDDYAGQIMRMAHDLFPEADARRKEAARWLRAFGL